MFASTWSRFAVPSMALASPCSAAIRPLLLALDRRSAFRSTAMLPTIFTAVVVAAATALSAKYYLSTLYPRFGLVDHRTRFRSRGKSYYGYAENGPNVRRRRRIRILPKRCYAKVFGWTSIMSEIHGYRSCPLLFITTFPTIPAVETNSCRHFSSTELRSLFSCCELDSEALIW
jgi:hypothetical protein